MRLEYFEYLSEIQKCGSISAAAKKIHMSHQGLSLAVKTLEEELNIILLARTTIGVTLTSEGRYVLDSYLDFAGRLKRVHYALEPLQGTLNLGSAKIIIECVLPIVLTNYYRDYPQVKVDTKILNPVYTVTEYTSGHTDLAFIAISSEQLKKLKKTNATLQFISFSYFDPCIEISKFSPLAKYKIVSINQLKNYTLIYNCSKNLGQDILQSDWFQLFPGANIIFEPIRRVYEQLIITDVAIGISSLFEQQSGKERSNNQLLYIPILENKRRYVTYLQNENQPLTPPANAFIEQLHCIYPDAIVL